ncbi:MAG: TIGR00159 family protein [Bdellovibrionales bacterium RIFOXYC1_FULL_54_43]|nr:MAG: TIGR00159 family protein [Bdellovibrionales bacterium RIFOXYC1_FULL_54_43]OFZ80603.1 MAG: TIGR00159 family protein [Bdellovibrionales bacterium RIFOXYD1_FULL_55_31]
MLVNLRSSVRWIDLLDVAIVAFILYRILLLIKGTRAMQMLTGLGILGIGFFLSSYIELFTTHWLLSYFFDYLILIVIVLFQDDLRRALTHVGKNPFFAASSAEEERENVDEIARAATRLARERIGGLIVLERETGLKNFIDTGSKLDSKVKAELLYSIFVPTSPIHDGAVIITNGRLAAAGCFLPLSKDPNIDKRYGTRHRAALGLTEDSDAIVVLVSEEAGEAHLVKNGKITTNLSEHEIRQSLASLLDLSRNQVNLPRKLKNWLRSVQMRRRGEE